MDKVFDKTVDVLTKFGDTLGRHLAPDNYGVQRSGSSFMFPSAGSAFHHVDRQGHKNQVYSSKRRDSAAYVGARQYSSDNLAASPNYSSFNNYRQNPGSARRVDSYDQAPYGAGFGAPLNYGSGPGYGYGSSYSRSYSGEFNQPPANMPYGAFPGNVAYAPDYYIAERRQVELVPAPPPRYIRQPVPVPYPVDRPVPQPYPVEVPRFVPVDRPVPVPVPSPVPVDRPVPVPVPVPVRSPPPPPVCVPVPVPVATPYPCYVPVGVPVASPRASPVMFEQSAKYKQRWVVGSPVMGMNPYMGYGSSSYIR